MFDLSGRFTGYRGIGKDVTESMLPVYVSPLKHKVSPLKHKKPSS